MGLRVLLVDDETLVRENLLAYLEDESMDVCAVDSAEAAIDRVRGGERFDVCVMDIRLPGMDGGAGILALAELDPDLVYLVHTGSVTYSPSPEMRRLGLRSEHVFHKPLGDMGRLADSIRAAHRNKGGPA